MKPMCPERSALVDRKILVGRNPARAAALVDLLRARGAVVEARELARLESMVGEAQPQRAIDDIDDFDWILLTSVNGFRFLSRALQARGIELARLSARFGVVGPATAEALERAGVVPEVCASDAHAHAQGLAAELEDQIYDAERVLIVRPETTRADLRERIEALGADVRSVPFYRNRPGANLERVARELSDGSYDAAVFAAPSGFDHLIAASSAHATEKLDEVALVAIGEVTAAAIEASGFCVAAVAREPTAEGIVGALEHALSS